MGAITRGLANNIQHFGSNNVETGTWTPTTNIGFASVAEAKYIKIGKFVQADVSATYNAGPGDSSQASAFGGLPFSGDNDCESISFKWISCSFCFIWCVINFCCNRYNL